MLCHVRTGLVLATQGTREPVGPGVATDLNKISGLPTVWRNSQFYYELGQADPMGTRSYFPVPRFRFMRDGTARALGDVQKLMLRGSPFLHRN